MGAQKSEGDHPLHETVRGVVAVVAVVAVLMPNLQLTYSRSLTDAAPRCTETQDTTGKPLLPMGTMTSERGSVICQLSRQLIVDNC